METNSMIELRWKADDPNFKEKHNTAWTLQYRYRSLPFDSKEQGSSWSEWIDVPYVSDET